MVVLHRFYCTVLCLCRLHEAKASLLYVKWRKKVPDNSLSERVTMRLQIQNDSARVFLTINVLPPTRDFDDQFCHKWATGFLRHVGSKIL